MKKKLWCVLCIMICMMMIAACGQKKNPVNDYVKQYESIPKSGVLGQTTDK